MSKEAEDEDDAQDDEPEDTMHADQETEREKAHRKKLAAMNARQDKWDHGEH